MGPEGHMRAAQRKGPLRGRGGRKGRGGEGGGGEAAAKRQNEKQEPSSWPPRVRRRCTDHTSPFLFPAINTKW